MRKSVGSDQRRAGVNPTATRDSLGHGSEFTAGEYYTKSTLEELLNAFYNRNYYSEKTEATEAQITEEDVGEEYILSEESCQKGEKK